MSTTSSSDRSLDSPFAPSSASSPSEVLARQVAKRKRQQEELEAAKRLKTDSCPFRAAGKHIGRAFSLFGNIEQALRDGREWLEVEDVEDIVDEDIRANVRLYRQITTTIPEVEDYLASRAPGVLVDVAGRMESGRAIGRTDDTSTCKDISIDILAALNGSETATKGLDRRRKIERGYNHPLTGRYLCPVELVKEWDDPESTIRTTLQEGKPVIRINENGEEELVNTNEESFPLFLYKDCKCDPDRLAFHLLENEFLLRIGLGIFISPSAATSSGASGNRSCKAGNAGRHRMTEVTVPAIAYVAMQARLALSSDEQFNARGQGNFSYNQFYHTVVELLQSDAFAPHLNHLLEVWNLRLFPEETRAKLKRKKVMSGTAHKMLRQLGKENHLPS